MAGNENIKADHPATQKGLIGKLFENIFKIFGLLLFSALVSIIVECIGITFFYPEEGYHHAESMMDKEIHYLVESTGGGGINSGAIKSTTEMINSTIEFLFIDSGIIENLNEVNELKPNDGKYVKAGKGFLNTFYDYILASMFILIVFIIRLGILFLSLPIFIMFALVGISDGLMQRDLRRWCGGNESGYIYHWAKRFAFPVMIISWFIYLSIPNSIHPNYIITPFAVLFGLVLMVMFSKFKKYL